METRYLFGNYLCMDDYDFVWNIMDVLRFCMGLYG